GVWLRRGRLVMVAPVRGHPGRHQAHNPLIPLSSFPAPPLQTPPVTASPLPSSANTRFALGLTPCVNKMRADVAHDHWGGGSVRKLAPICALLLTPRSSSYSGASPLFRVVLTHGPTTRIIPNPDPSTVSFLLS